MTAQADQQSSKRLNLEKATNFMRQFRDPDSRELKKLSANQFMEVWSHYDKDGECQPIHKILFIRKFKVPHIKCLTKLNFSDRSFRTHMELIFIYIFNFVLLCICREWLHRGYRIGWIFTWICFQRQRDRYRARSKS